MKKTVSMVLACVMLGTTFAQCAVAEEGIGEEAVIEAEIQPVEDESMAAEPAAEESLAMDTVVVEDFAVVDEPSAENPSAGAAMIEPVTEGLAVEAITPEEAVTEEPATEEPAAETAAMEEAVTEEPAVETTESEEPATEEPTAETAAAEEAVTEEPVTETAATEEPATEEPVAETAAPEEAATEESAVETPVSEEPTVEMPAIGVPIVGAPVIEEPIVNVPASEEDSRTEEKESEATDPADADNEKENATEAGEAFAAEAVAVDEIRPIAMDPGIMVISDSIEKTSGGFSYIEEKGSITIKGLSEDNKNRESLVIPDTIGGKDVTKIAANAFKGKAFTGTLTLPKYLTEIGASAFEGCGFTGGLNLEGISSLTEIKEKTFAGCSFTGELKFPTALRAISNNAFEGCKFIGALKIEKNVTSIGNYAFSGCSGFTSLTLPSGLRSIGISAFEGCTGLKGALEIPGKVAVIGTAAFRNCSGLTGLTLPSSSLTAIAESTFEGCVALSGTVTISKKVTEIGDNAFKGCQGITKLSLPSSGLRTIGNYAFNGCTGLTGKLTLSTALRTIGSWAFSGCKGLTGTLDFSKLKSLERIGQEAFLDCSGFTGSLNLSKSKYKLEIGRRAFMGCSGFNGTLTLPSDTSKIAADAIFDSVVMKDGTAPIELQKSDKDGIKLALRAGNSKLTLADSMVTWSVSSNSVVETPITDGTVKPAAAGSVTVKGTVKYNKKAVRKKVVVREDASIAKGAVFEQNIFKPGTISLKVSIESDLQAVKTLSGYFCLKKSPSKKIEFSYDFKSKPKYTGDVKINIKISSGVAAGKYYLGALTLKNTAGVTTKYTYDASTGIWKNGSGNRVKLDVNTGSTNSLVVKDGFGSNNGFEAYITSAKIKEKLADFSGKTATIKYDSSNHKANKAWFAKIKEVQNAIIVLSDDKVQWYFYGKDVTKKTSGKFDCLVKLSKFDSKLYGNEKTSMALKFASLSALPGKATVRIRADQMNNLYKQTKKIYVYSIDSNKALKKQNIDVEYVKSGKQYWYEFEVTSSTPDNLIMSSKKLDTTSDGKVTSIKLNQTTLGLVKGETYKLKATVGPSLAKNKKLTWKSSNTKIATVDKNGKVTAKKYGTATISAKAQDGSGTVAKCTLMVGYKIKYVLNKGKNNKNNPGAYYNTAITLKAPTRAGYKFKGWYTDKQFKNRIKKIPKSYRRNLTLYAKWQKK